MEDYRIKIEFASLDLIKCAMIILRVMEKFPSIDPEDDHIILCNSLTEKEKSRFYTNLVESNIMFK